MNLEQLIPDDDMTSVITDAVEDLGSSLRCVTFRLEDEMYGVNVQSVREVLKIHRDDIRIVPGAPRNVLGVINVRGLIVTVIDTRLTFDLPRNPLDQNNRVIIVELINGHIAGFLVDSVSEVRDIYESMINIYNTTEDNAKYIYGIAHVDDNVIIIINFTKVFDESDLGLIES